MGRIFNQFQWADEWDILWTFCFFIQLFIVITIIFIFVRTLQHMYCIPQSSALMQFQSKTESKNFKIYSTFSLIFSALGAVDTFSELFICAQWTCPYTELGYSIDMIWIISCFWAHVLLYFIFIGRLLNPRYIRIYQYPKYIHYLLWVGLLLLILIDITAIIIGRLVFLGHLDLEAAFSVSTVEVTVDCILSVSLTILYFRPICSRQMHNVISAGAYNSIVRKYAMISVLQMMVAASAGFSFLLWYYCYMTDAPPIISGQYAQIRNVLQLLDCLLLMVCIYAGFARRKTVRDLCIS